MSWLNSTSKRLRPTLILGVAGVAVVATFALRPRTADPDAKAPPAPYFSTARSFVGHGTVENLDRVANAATPVAAALTAPASIWTVASANAVNVSWTRQPLAAKYEVSVKNEATGHTDAVAVDTPLYTISGAHSGTTYSVAVTSIGRDNQRSSPSARIAVTPTGVASSTKVSKQDFEVASWMPSDFSVADARNSFERSIGTETEINPFWYNFAASGVLEAKGGARDPELVARAHQVGQRVIPTITNNYDPDRMTALLADASKQEQLRRAIVDEVRQGGFDGIDLDFENMHAADREAFTGFVTALATDLHAAGAELEVTVQPKKSDGDNWDGPGAIDGRALGIAADRIKVMTYDFSRTNTQPGPIAPLSWTLDVVHYWTSIVPPAKVLAGLPFYGYDWSLDSDDDHGITWETAQKSRSQYSVSENVDQNSGEPYFTYSDQHGPRIAYYQDAASISRKVSAIKTTGVAGIAIWLLGQEDPGNFAAIQKETTTVTHTVQLPLNVGVKLQGADVQVSVTRSADEATLEVRYGPSTDALTHTAKGGQTSLVPLPPIKAGEVRYIIAIAFDAKGQELRRSGVAFVAGASAH